jgi:hypothetical protein
VGLISFYSQEMNAHCSVHCNVVHCDDMFLKKMNIYEEIVGIKDRLNKLEIQINKLIEELEELNFCPPYGKYFLEAQNSWNNKIANDDIYVKKIIKIQQWWKKNKLNNSRKMSD